MSSTLRDWVNSLTNQTKQEQSQCERVRFNYSELAYLGHILLEISHTVRTAEDGATALGLRLRSR